MIRIITIQSIIYNKLKNNLNEKLNFYLTYMFQVSNAHIAAFQWWSISRFSRTTADGNGGCRYTVIR